MTPPTLLVLAAGMGSRYGGLKQMDPMGPNGETVLDYSVFDAIRAGFGTVVFIIREDFALAFKESVGGRFADRIKVDYVFQKLEDLPTGFSVPHGREKPWGTGHAILAARHVIEGHFAVINADDFYGRDAYQRAADFIAELPATSTEAIAMVGYPLFNTLSDHGHVNRGLCKVTPDGRLVGVEEFVNIAYEADGRLRGEGLNGTRQVIPPDTLVSMNLWVFGPGFFDRLEKAFAAFLTKSGDQMKSECYIPTVVDDLIRVEKAQCHVLETTGRWFGVTYPADKAVVVESIRKLIDEGEYPRSWPHPMQQSSCET